MLQLSICTELRKIDGFVPFVVGPKQLFEKKEAILELISNLLLAILLLVGSGLVVLILALGLTLLHFGTVTSLAHSREIWTGDTCVGLLTDMVPWLLAVSGPPSPVEKSALDRRRRQ
jgi:hypothetical protein